MTKSKPNRAGLYARHATTGSIEEQLRLCRQYAAEENYEIVGIYHDEGSANLDIRERPGLRALLEDARAGKLDTVLAEDVDRFGRKMAHVLAFLEKMRALKIHVWTVSEGEICPGFQPVPLQHIFKLYPATETPPVQAMLYSRYSTATQNASSAGAFLGRRGGQARARRLTPARRSEIAKAAADARWRKDEGVRRSRRRRR